MPLLKRIYGLRGFAARFEYESQTLLALAIKAIGVVISFSVSILITRHFGAAGAGSFALVTTTLMVASTVSLVGLDYILIRSISGDIRTERFGAALGTIQRVVKTVLSFAVLISFLIFLVSSILGPTIGSGSLLFDMLAACAWGVIPLAAMRLVSSTLRGNERVLLGQFLDGPASGVLALFIMLGFLARPQFSTLLAIQVYYFAIAISAIIGGLVCLGDIRKWKVEPELSNEQLIASGSKILAVVLTSYLIDWAIIVSLSSQYSEVEVGVFRVAWQFSTLFNVVVVAFDAVSGPRIAAAWRTDDRALIGTLIRKSRLAMVMIAAPLLFAGMVWPSWFLSWFGPEFSFAENVLRILLIGQIVNIITGPVGAALVMTGNERLSLINAFLSAVISFAVLYFTLPAFGLYGAACASAVAIIFRNLATAVEVQWLIKRGTVTERVVGDR